MKNILIQWILTVQKEKKKRVQKSKNFSISNKYGNKKGIKNRTENIQQKHKISQHPTN